MISNVNMLCRRMRVDGCGRSFIYVVYLRFNGYTKGCFTYHCRVYAVSRISKNIKFVWNLRLLIIHSCIILGNYILGTLQQHSNTLLITKSKMYIGVRQIQVGKRIVLSENKYLNIVYKLERTHLLEFKKQPRYQCIICAQESLCQFWANNFCPKLSQSNWKCKNTKHISKIL